ncbi:MAG TPA: hypothetical protein VMB91_03400, partial [Solirubrobacteraceae bacterium]|nr:hypothetical protein [Solirubrobacteraceae bacterium]
APFNQAEWAQEDPGSENDHVIYPRLTAPVFRDLAVNSAMPLGTAVYSQWMSVNEGDFAPTPLHVDSFTLRQAPVATAAGAQYLRLAARAGAAFEQFETERSEWTPRTPYRQMVAASSRFTSATRGGVRSLEEARWPKRIRRLLRSFDEVAGTLVQRAVPPTDLTSSSLAAWNSRFTEAAERGAAVAAKLRLALGLPGAGPSYHR